MKKLVFPLLTIAAIFYFSSCKKGDTGAPGAQGPDGPVLKGSITGYASLFDQYGTKILTDLKGIQVSIEGTTFAATTDSIGKWQIDNLQTGVYNINFTKNGYAAAKVQSIQFVGGGTANIKNTPLSAMPAYQVSSAITAKDSVGIIPQTTDTVAKGINVVGTFTTNDTKSRSAVLFVSNSSAVSSSANNYIIAVIPRNPFPVDKKNPNGTNFSQFISADELHNAGFKKGDNVYIVAYSAANGFNTTSNYQDPATGKTVYNAIGTPSTVISKVLSY